MYASYALLILLVLSLSIVHENIMYAALAYLLMHVPLDVPSVPSVCWQVKAADRAMVSRLFMKPRAQSCVYCANYTMYGAWELVG